MMIIKTVNIRTANLSQIRSEIERLDRAVFTSRRAVQAPFTRNEWKDIWDSKRYTVYFARCKKSDPIGGFIVAQRTRPKNLYIYSLGVHPDVRKLGIATRLLNEVLFKLRKNMETVSLHVSVNNEGAIQLYKSLSFQVLHKVKNYYARGDDAFYLQLRPPMHDAE